MPKFPTTPALIATVQAFVPDPSNVAAAMFPVKQTANNQYEFDLIQGSRGKTGYRHPDGEGGTVAARPRERKTVTLPTLREKKTLKESTLRWMDAPGSHAPQRAMDAIAEELLDLDGIIERTHEYARWKLLCTGAITLTGDVTDTYTFGIGSTATAGVVWTTIATSTPIANLIAWKEMVRQASGQQPTELWLSSQAIRYIFESASAQLVLGPTTKDIYARTGAVARLVDMDVKIQDYGYRDDAGAFKYYMSTNGTAGNMAIIKVPGPVGVTAEGAVVDAKAPEGHVGKFAKSWETEDPSARWILECQTALPGITQANNFGAFTLW